MTGSIKLADIHRKYDTDKGTDHNYIATYDALFAPFQDRAVNMLEVGVLSGGSLKMFHEFFQKATVYGMDNFSQTSGFGGKVVSADATLSDLATYQRIRVFKCDSRSGVAVAETVKDVRFDLIIDDGDHTMEGQFNTFKSLYPVWNGVNGVYIIEDVHYSFAHPLEQKIKEAYPDVNVNVMKFNVAARADDVLLVITKSK